MNIRLPETVERIEANEQRIDPIVRHKFAKLRARPSRRSG